MLRHTDTHCLRSDSDRKTQNNTSSPNAQMHLMVTEHAAKNVNS